MEQTNEPVLAFVVEVTGACNGTVYGNLYAINYESFYKHIHDKALDTAYIMMKYECGVRTKDVNTVINSFPDKEYGKLQSFQYQPYSQEELADLLHREEQEREHFPEENPSIYIARL